MILFKTIKKAYLYFFLFLLISIIITFFTPIGVRNYAPIVFGLGCFPIFGINSFGYLEKFSSELRQNEPEIFKKNEVFYGYFKGKHIMIQNVFDNDDFKNIKDKNTFDLYLKMKASSKLMILSFLLVIIFSILVIQTKPFL
ncbi:MULTISPECIES: hypothetical protein [Flavobacterium]|uniref:DUF3899 domain-containing protein n=1 Tax=Flavobacterium hankyongi TaxID=1176532 RepID=A0ABP8ZN31_9FLAO|nr:hypothetical protein [Flavobacterium sp. N1846]